MALEDNVSNSSSIDSLQVKTMKLLNPDLLPPFLILCKHWNEGLAKAFAIGLVLGKQFDMSKSMNVSYASNSREEVAICVYFRGHGMRIMMDNLRSAIDVNSEWKDGDITYNPFDKLLDIEKFNNKDIYSNYFYNYYSLCSKDLRNLFANCVKDSVAMIATDVAILKWFSHAIQSRTVSDITINSLGKEDLALILPLCGLSLYPIIQEFCSEDILTVISDIPRYQMSFKYKLWGRDCFYHKFLTLLKMLDDNLIRSKVEELAAQMYNEDTGGHGLIFTTTRHFLGVEHPFVKSMEKNIPAAKWVSYNVLWQIHLECDYKIHSMSSEMIFDGSTFFYIGNPTFLSACIEANNSLKWEMAVTTSKKKIKFSSTPSSQPRQIRLFVISTCPQPPAAFWEEMRSCSDIPMFQKTLKSPLIRRMILTYEITILECSSIYTTH